MKGKSLGYDPELGKKFSDESSGLVIGRAKSSPRKSEAQAIEEFSQEHGRAPDAQQLHDAMMSPTFSAARPATTVKLPPAPTRAQFSSQEEFEEALGYWRGHVGRIKAMVDLAARSKSSPAE